MNLLVWLKRLVLHSPQIGDGEGEMVIIQCDKCGQLANLSLYRSAPNWSQHLEFRGVITCDCGDKHTWPMAIKTDNIVQSTDQMMPVLESVNLNQDVPEGLEQDIQEAEKAHYAQIYKAGVVMCRRAIQLGLQESPHNIPDGPFGGMLKQAQAKAPPTLSPQGFALANGVRDYGDAGAHRRQELSASDARTAIFSAVRVLNELFPA